MKKINLEAILKDMEGNALGSTKQYAVVNEKREIVMEGGFPLIAIWTESADALTLKKALIASILAGEEKMSKEAKADDYLLLLKIAPGGDVDLDNKETERLKTLCGIHQPTLIYGQIAELLKKEN